MYVRIDDIVDIVIMYVRSDGILDIVILLPLRKFPHLRTALARIIAPAIINF